MRGRSSLFTALAVVLTATGLSVLVAGAPPAPGASSPPAGPGAPGGEAAPAAPPSHASAATAAAPPVMRATSDRVTEYKLFAELVPATHSVRGRGSVVWRNTARVATDRLYVHLYLNAFRDAQTVFWRTPLRDFRGEPWGAPGRIEVERFFARELDADLWPENPTTPGDPDDATDIEVRLPRPVEPGESLTIDMAWTSHLPSIVLRTGHYGSFHMVAQWFPKLARLEPDGTWSHFPFHRLSEFYADYGTYDVTITAPEAFVIGAVGEPAPVDPAAPAMPAAAPDPAVPAAPSVDPVAAPSADPALPSASAAPSAAPAAPRATHRFVAEDVHDFAFAAWDRFRSLSETTPSGVKITCLYPEGYEAAARVEVDAVKFGLGYFGAAFGAYPYRTLTIVHPPWGAGEAGGMEYPTLITTGGSWMTEPLGAHPLEILTLHELAHQWFYGLVGTNEHRWPFLDEGLTSYAEMDACEALFPDASVGSAFGLRVGLPAVYRAASLEATRSARTSDSAASFRSGRDYGALVYSRTAVAMRTLGNVYGEDTVRRAVGLYARRHRFDHPTPDDLFAAIREGVGPEAEDALREALTEPSSVDYVADGIETGRRGGGAPGFESHVLVRRRGPIRLPVDVLLVAADGSSRTVRWDAAQPAEWLHHEGPEPIVAAVVDPQHRVLLDEDLSNNAVRASGSSFAWRALEAASFAGGVIARGILP